MKPATLKDVLQEKIKEMEKYLNKTMKDEKSLLKEKHLAYAHDILNNYSHQIGYMTGAIEQTKEFIRLLDITDAQYRKEREEMDAHREEIRKQLDDLIRKHKKEKKHVLPKNS